MSKDLLFVDYYREWIELYKKGAIRDVTLNKYYMTLKWLTKLCPSLKIGEINRTMYQSILNDYAETHEKQTTIDFHHQLKSAIIDAVEDGLISKDPTRKIILKGKIPREKKTKFLSQFDLQLLINQLDLSPKLNPDWMILLIAKTGMRFSEALGLTPNDFDFAHQTVSINKTWDYKDHVGFSPTKNKASIRKIRLDWQLIIQFAQLIKELPQNDPIFVDGRMFNSTYNDRLARHCKKAGVPVITIHALRHTHASILLSAGVSIASVAQRLGHASMTTTQKTYIHVIKELENRDVDIIMRTLSVLG